MQGAAVQRRWGTIARCHVIVMDRPKSHSICGFYIELHGRFVSLFVFSDPAMETCWTKERLRATNRNGQTQNLVAVGRGVLRNVRGNAPHSPFFWKRSLCRHIQQYWRGSNVVRVVDSGLNKVVRRVDPPRG